MNKIEIRTQEEFENLPKSFNEFTFIDFMESDYVIESNIENAVYRFFGSSSAELFGSSSAMLYGSSIAKLYESSRAVLKDYSRVVLFDFSIAVLRSFSKAVLFGSSSAKLYGSSSAKLYESSRAVLYGLSSAKLMDSSSAKLYESSSAELYGSSSAKLYESSSAKLMDSSSAELYYFSSAHIYSEDVSVSIAVDKSTVISFVSEFKGANILNGVIDRYSVQETSYEKMLELGYLRADGIAKKIKNHKKSGDFEVFELFGNQDKTSFCVKKGETFSHGETLEEAKKDLIYKIMDRDKSDYENLSIDHVFTLEEAVECYRVITGACSLGVKGFVSSLGQVKEEYSINEIIGLTKGSYGDKEFKSFFKKD